MKSTGVDESLSTVTTTVLFQRRSACYKIFSTEWEIYTKFRDWEKLQLRDCDYKNHRIFTLRCIHKELVPVSIRLKTTLRTEKARKIIRTVEKQLLQARIKFINSILDNNAKERELCRSKLASILSTSNFKKCKGFVEKVSELRLNKVKSRQVKKFNNLICKKEGNITSKASQATRAIPQAVTPFPRTGLLPKKPTQSGLISLSPKKTVLTTLTPREILPGAALLPRKPVQSTPTALLPRKVVLTMVTLREAIPTTALLPRKSELSTLIAFLPRKVVLTPREASPRTVLLPRKPAWSTSTALLPRR